MTELGRQQTNQYYAPLAYQGAGMLERFTETQLAAMRDHLLAATTLIDRHRARLRGESASDQVSTDR